MGMVHVIGAGLAGLAAAVRLTQAGRAVTVHEGAKQAGGRCRTYHDAALDMVLDNGNHLVLSGNRDALAFVAAIGAADALVGPAEADFPFVDLATGARWSVRPNAGPLPWWIFAADRRVPGTRALDYLSLARLLGPGAAEIGGRMACAGPLYDKLWRPFLLAALNIEPPHASAALAGAVIRETLAKGGAASRPLIAAHGLSHAFIDPAIRFIEAHGGRVRLDRRVRAVTLAAEHAKRLEFGDESIELGGEDRVVMAAPAPVAAALLPGVSAPQTFCAIVNAHFKMIPPADAPPMIGLINATTEWIFAFPDRLSVTISGADRLLETPREALAATIWSEVCVASRVEGPMPPWQVIKERRATFAATPQENARRPQARTAWRNIALAGDWTATGLPATIEGAIRSGNTAADLVMRDA